ncbi:MAG: transcription termination/antitermination factor NusG [Chthonomonadaceae bacterium]|nr:transcription termination/antitermination factor NusG [Chthonomonadaceae bacterium]
MLKYWYALHTYSGHEKKVKETIERRAETMGLREKIGDIFVPTETETQTRNGKKYEMERKVLPGYVFIEMTLDENTWHLIKSTTGVIGFVSPGPKPTPLQKREIDGLRQSTELAPAITIVKFEKNETLRVNAGPFTDFTGKVAEVNADKEKLKLLISIFGRDTSVELDFKDVEKVI